MPAEDLVDLAEEGILAAEALGPEAPSEQEVMDIENLLGIPVEPEIPPPDAPEAPRVRQGPEDRISVEIGGGARLVYYRARQEFYAECPLRGIGHSANCRRARTAKASENNRRPAQGRPLGLLVAWCEAAENHDSSDSHKLEFHTTHDQRNSARQFLKTVSGSEALFLCERLQEPREDSEPELEP